VPELPRTPKSKTTHFLCDLIQVRTVGRPLAATDAQQAQILRLREAGKSLRAIAAATGLSLRAVDTIVSKTARRGSAVRRLRERVLISLINSTDAKTRLRKSNRRSPALRGDGRRALLRPLWRGRLAGWPNVGLLWKAARSSIWLLYGT
jgi:hypothetical protein